MENKPLYIPESKKWKGLTVYCYRCKTNVSEICKETGQSLKSCKHGEKHVFKVYVHVPGTENQRKTKKLKTRDINEAIKQAIDFEQYVKVNINQITEDKKKNQKRKEVNPATPNLLIHAMARYISWLNNEGVPAHLKKERSQDHIKDVERAFKTLAESLVKSGNNLETLSIEDLSDNIVGNIFSSLERRAFANRTFNKYFGYYTSFLKWYSEEYEIPMRNWFERVKRKKLNPKPEAITYKEYEALLKQITPENGIKEYENGVKPIRNVYRPWLADGIRLALETGRRREEVINLKWNNIHESDGIQVIKAEDFKVNRIQNRTTNEEKKFIYIPITESLRRLLVELGYEKSANTDNFILAPDLTMNRKRVMADTLSRGFTHYFNQLKTGRKLTFKCLRKTYITNLEIFMGGGNTKAITGHSNDQVIERSYIDRKEMAKAAQGFIIFSKEKKRDHQLKDIRTTTKRKTEQKDLEV